MGTKKRLALINAVPYGSTGKIVKGIATVAVEKNYETFIYYSWSKILKKSSDKNVMVGSFSGKFIHMILGKITGLNGFFSVIDTYRLIRRLKKFRPDVINMHIMHNWNINLKMIFTYIKKNNIPIIWTMHDCWAFTGQCPHFVMAKCDKWKTGCYRCPQYKQYPAALVDRTKKMWRFKKDMFTSVNDITFVTPSQWLFDLMKQSYLKDYPVKVIHNGIDLSVFKPRKSDFRKKYNCENKTVLLGVAFDGGKRKGLDVFTELAKRLDEKYQIVMVGTDDKIDAQLPDNIISIHKTANQVELAEIYSSSDIFLNPTREEVLGLVNIEALACGTPVIMFRTGGSPECIDSTCGYVVECDDIDAMESRIVEVATEKPFSSDACILYSKKFDHNARFSDYITIFKEILCNKK